MAPRTPQQSKSAGPFITLSLSKKPASKLRPRLKFNTPSPSYDSSPSSAGKEDEETTLNKHVPQFFQLPPGTTIQFGSKASSETNGPQDISTSDKTSKKKEQSIPPSTFHSNSTESAYARPVSKNASPTTANNTSRSHDDASDIHSERRSSTASLTDAATRSSRRTRKLTTKAKALAGTNFLPSLQTTDDLTANGQHHATENETPGNNGDTMLPSSQTTDEVVIVGQRYYLVDVVKRDKVDAESQSPTQPRPPQHGTPEKVSDEVPVESVEVPAVRTSARERKPTARAVESETLRPSRKRPASPSTSERASKIAKTSSLPPNTISLHAESATSVADSIEANPVSMQAVTPDVVSATNTIEPAPQDTDNGESHAIKTTPANQGAEAIGTKPTVRASTSQPPQNAKVVKPCNLRCLSPASRLLAFAAVAVDWEESDVEPTDDELLEMDLESKWAGTSGDSFKKVRLQFCQCPQKGAHLPPGATKRSRSKKNTRKKVGTAAARPSRPVRRSKRDKPSDLLDDVDFPTTKRQKSLSSTTASKKKGTSYEQRMQSDYLASQNQKQPVSRQPVHSNVAKSKQERRSLPAKSQKARSLPHQLSQTYTAEEDQNTMEDIDTTAEGWSEYNDSSTALTPKKLSEAELAERERQEERDRLWLEAFFPTEEELLRARTVVKAPVPPKPQSIKLRFTKSSA